MNRKKTKEKPPTGATEGGESENQRGRDIFYPEYTTIPDYQQVDIPKFVDALRVHAELFRLRADICQRQAVIYEKRIQEAALGAMIQMGGTAYPIGYGAVSYGPSDE